MTYTHITHRILALDAPLWLLRVERRGADGRRVGASWIVRENGREAAPGGAAGEKR